jgi:hypothetical protein
MKNFAVSPIVGSVGSVGLFHPPLRLFHRVSDSRVRDSDCMDPTDPTIPTCRKRRRPRAKALACGAAEPSAPATPVAFRRNFAAPRIGRHSIFALADGLRTPSPRECSRSTGFYGTRGTHPRAWGEGCERPHQSAIATPGAEGPCHLAGVGLYLAPAISAQHDRSDLSRRGAMAHGPRPKPRAESGEESHTVGHRLRPRMTRAAPQETFPVRSGIGSVGWIAVLREDGSGSRAQGGGASDSGT